MSYLKKHAEIKENVVLDDGQESIRKQLEELIDDSSMNVIGLEGEWGSGKSTILKYLRESFNEEDVYTYEYDLWAHQEDNLRYSFSKGVLDDFKPQDKSQKEGDEEKISFEDLNKKADDLISIRNESSPSLNMRMAGLIFVLLFLPVLANIANVLWTDKPSFYIVASLCIPVLIVSLWYTYTEKKQFNWSGLKDSLWHVCTKVWSICTKKQFSWSGLKDSLWHVCTKVWSVCKKIWSICAKKQFSWSGLKDSLWHVCTKVWPICTKIWSVFTKKQFSWFPILVLLFIVVVIGDAAVGFRGKNGAVEKIITDSVKCFFSFSSDILHVDFSVLQLFLVGVFLFILFKNFKNISDKDSVKDALSLYNGNYVEKSYSTTVYPRKENVCEFMECFEKFLLEQGKKHCIIIFDNLDRLPENKIKEFWTFLQTFFVGRKTSFVKTIVAFERKTVENAWENGVGAAYLEKSLDFTIYVPLCSRMDLKKFFMDQWLKVFNNNEKDKDYKEKKDEVDINKAGEHVFNLYHLLKKGSVSFSSRRGVIDAINEIKREKDKIHMFFTDKKVLGNIEKKTIEYPYELAAMYVFRKQCVNSMFSETVKEGIVKYYINAFIGCKDWVSQFIPEKDDDGKKMCLQRIFNRLIQNNNQNANNMQSYYIIDYFKEGRLEIFFADPQGHDLEDIKKDFDYIFLENLQRIRDDGNDIVNVVKSLLFCRMKNVSSAEDMEIKWGLLFNKIRNIKKWPNQLWCWNALIYNSSEYLNQAVWEKDVRIATERKCFITEELRSYYTTCENEYNGKICLPKGYLKRDFWPYSEHKMKKDGKLFFYDDRRKDEEGLVVNQLNEFDESDWIKSLQNFWCPGVIQYHRLKDKSRCNPGPLRGALKNFFQRGNVNPFEYQKGPCKHDKCYYDIWLELINVLSVDDMSELKENIKNFFPKGYHAKLDEVFKKKGVN